MNFLLRPFRRLSEWFEKSYRRSERKRRAMIAADPTLRQFYNERRLKTARSGMFAMLAAMEQNDMRQREFNFEELHYDGGDPFPGKWRVTFERID